MKEEQLQLIRQKCIEANPAIIDTVASAGCPNCHDHDGAKVTVKLDRPIRLADVLLAIEAWGKEKALEHTIFPLPVSAYPEEQKGVGIKLIKFWNLRKDDLTEQSDECITFLAELLK